MAQTLVCEQAETHRLSLCHSYFGAKRRGRDTLSGAVRYREVLPHQLLASFIECFWVLESDGLPASVQPERILPDGCVELVLNLRAPFRERKATGEEQLQPSRFLVGQMTRPVLIVPSDEVQLIGIRFQPGGTCPFFRFSLTEVTNQVVELAAVSSELEHALAPVLENASNVSWKIAALEKLLLERVRSGRQDSWLIDLARQVVSNGGRASIDTLASAAGISGRQLERRFLREIGLGPKLFCRILRFQQVFRALDRDDPNWAAVAADCGYYDQAHLIRDFQQFAGQTPAALISESRPLTEAFTRQSRMSDFSNTAHPTLS